MVNALLSGIDVMVRIRRLVIGLCGFAVAVAISRLFCYRGIIRSVQIASGSMAESLLGPHYELDCRDCQLQFRCGTDSAPPESLVVCPNCGYDRNSIANVPVQRGDAVLVDRWPAIWNGWRRWDVIAFRSNDQDSTLVKRIVGMPGEQSIIEGGNLFVGDQMVSKDWQQVMSLKVLVHDNRFQPRSPDLPRRWGPVEPRSAWQVSSTGSDFEYHPPGPIDDSDSNRPLVDWLEYRHWHCMLSPLPRSKPTTILDNDSYNQGTSRQLNEVDELMVRTDVESTGEGRVYWRMISGGSSWTLVWNPTAGQSSLLRDDFEVASCQHASTVKANGSFAIFDEIVWWSLDDRTVLSHRFRRQPSRAPATSPIAIGAAGAGIKLSNIRVYRDVYYLNPLGTSDRWKLSKPLGPGEFFVMGDNPPISEDARGWNRECLPADRIVGLVHRW